MLTKLNKDKTTRYLIFFISFLFVAMILLSLNNDVSNSRKKRYREFRY